jgi:uncharacterized membrane protein YheB (UPF0754 family)
MDIIYLLKQGSLRNGATALLVRNAQFQLNQEKTDKSKLRDIIQNNSLKVSRSWKTKKDKRHFPDWRRHNNQMQWGVLIEYWIITKITKK